MAIGDYTKTDWNTGDTITETKMDNNENKTDELDKTMLDMLRTYSMGGIM